MTRAQNPRLYEVSPEEQPRLHQAIPCVRHAYPLKTPSPIRELPEPVISGFQKRQPNGSSHTLICLLFFGTSAARDLLLRIHDLRCPDNEYGVQAKWKLPLDFDRPAHNGSAKWKPFTQHLYPHLSPCILRHRPNEISQFIVVARDIGWTIPVVHCHSSLTPSDPKPPRAIQQPQILP